MIYKPWQRVPDIPCARCAGRAERRAYVSGFSAPLPSGPGRASVHFTDESSIASELVCGDCCDAAMSALCDVHGTATAEPLRGSWRTWLLFEFWLTRWTGAIDVWVHNWRFERGIAGKRFGYRMNIMYIPDDSPAEVETDG